MKTTVLTLLAFASVVGGHTAIAQTVSPLTTPPVTDPSVQCDLVLVFDGYDGSPGNDQTRALQDGQAFVSKLLATEPYSTYEDYFNIHGIYRESVQAGTDNYVAGTFVDTAYNSGLQASAPGAGPTLLMWDDMSSLATQGFAMNATSENGLTRAQVDAMDLAPGFDGVVLALVNTPTYSGAARFAGHGAFYNGSGFINSSDVGVHELGHAFAMLGDEYGSGGLNLPSPLSDAQLGGIENLASPPGLGAIKWQKWIQQGLVTSTPQPGGQGFDTGIFHPEATCMMNNPSAMAPPGTNDPHCQVCAETVVRAIYQFADGITAESPAVGTPITITQGDMQVFSIDERVPGTTLVTWNVRLVGASTNAWSTSTFSTGPNTHSLPLDTSTYAVGQYVVEALVRDDSAFLTPAELSNLESQRTWTVEIVPAKPDLVIAFPAITTSPFEPGAQVDVGGLVENHGSAAATSDRRVTAYLTEQAGVISLATDFVLGSWMLTGTLPVGGVEYGQWPVTLPFQIDPNAAPWITMVVDPLDAIAEVDETNNVGSSFLPIAPAPISGCPGALEFGAIDVDHAEISATSPTPVALEITAPCRAGDLYVLYASVTGTSPGFPLGPFVLPIVKDDVTVFIDGLVQAGSPQFVGFVGSLDANGRATAAVLPTPTTLGAGDYKVYFAGVTVNVGTGISGVTNAVTLLVNP